MPNFFQKLGSAVTAHVRGVRNDARQVVANLQAAVREPGKVATQIPGIALTTMTNNIHLGAQVVGKGLEVVGDVTKNDKLRDVGTTIVRTDTAIVNQSMRDPVASGQIVGGVVLIGTGLGGPAGAALVANGTRQLLAGTASEILKEAGVEVVPGAPPTVGAPVPLRPPEAISPAVPSPEAAAPTRPTPSLVSRVVELVRELLNDLFPSSPPPSR